MFYIPSKEKEAVPINVVTSGQVSKPPVFDLERVRKVNRIIDCQEDNMYPALNLALKLGLYNRYNHRNFTTAETLQFLSRSFRLIKAEDEAAKPDNLLPTIGFEVESPRKPFELEKDKNHEQYAKFFDSIGMPRNKMNRNSYPNSFWEFSPPSYSASVQNRILCELIKGRFIPSLTTLYTPHYIRNYLDEKLISLHINLGLPDWLNAQEFHDETGQKLDTVDDIRLLASVFSFAFSSPQRLLYRSQTAIALVKDAEQTSKSTFAPSRIEIKAFEVRDKSTYRLMNELQHVTCCTFAYLGNRDKNLSEIWLRIKNECSLLFEEHDIAPGLLSNKKSAAKFVARSHIRGDLREIITRNAMQVKHLLSQA